MYMCVAENWQLHCAFVILALIVVRHVWAMCACVCACVCVDATEIRSEKIAVYSGVCVTFAFNIRVAPKS